MKKIARSLNFISASLFLLALILTACSPQNRSVTPTTAEKTVDPTVTAVLYTATSAPSVTSTTAVKTTPTQAGYDPSNPDAWKELPVIPETVSEKMKALYQAGMESGLNQNAFSKTGDCETSSPYFLAPFDLRETGYRLGDYASLTAVISQYKGSFARESLAAKPGGNVATALSPVWADKTLCKTNEAPLICEIRVNKPAILLVMFGTNDVNMSSRTAFEANLRQLLDFAIMNNVVPVLATKADNIEGDGSMNAIIARVAYEYEIPLWNFWRAVQDLPNGGLQTEDNTHLTYAQPFFDSPENMQNGWPVRNLTALQMLEMLTRELNK